MRTTVRPLLTGLLLTGLLLVAGTVLTACAAQGALQFHANGEDFVRQGFVSKDGWAITFDHVYITLSEIEAYQTDPPYDPHAGSAVNAKKKAGLAGTHTVDLATGDEDADPILVGQVADAPAGHYNAVHWRMVRGDSGPSEGYAIAIAGRAAKDGQTVAFELKIENEYEFTCGEFVGDERKGLLTKGGKADQEMTFHMDHLFGDAETPLDDDLNIGALGFQPFADLAENGKVDVDMAALESGLSPSDYQQMVDTLSTLGHVGEGHCHCEEH